MDVVSVGLGFLLGTATGAAGGYFATKYTDKRRVKDAASARESKFNQLWQRHQALLAEMKEDLEQPEHEFLREFFILDSKWSFNHDGQYLAYHLDKHPNLEQQVRVLEDQGLVRNVTEPGKNVERYWFEEHFVELLKAKRI